MGCCTSTDIIRNIETRFKQTEDALPFKEIPSFVLLKSYKIHSSEGKISIDNMRQSFLRAKIEPNFVDNKRFREMLKRIQTGNQVSLVKLYCLSLLSSHGKPTEKAGLVWDILYELSLNGEMLVNELSNVAIAMIWLSDNLNHAVIFRHEQRLNEGIDNLTRRASFSFPSLDGTARGKEKFISQLTTHQIWKQIFSASSIRHMLYVESLLPYRPSLASLFIKDSVMACASGHSLISIGQNPSRFTDDSYGSYGEIKCNVCSTEIEGRAWGCSECSYYLCYNCRQWILNTVEYPDSNVRCGNRHSLRVTPISSILYGGSSTRSCSSCKQEILKDSLYCMACNFDICWSCAEKLEEVLKRQKVPRCAQGHETDWTNEIRGDEKGEFRCKECRSVKNGGGSGFHCERCNVGYCLNCAEKSVLRR